MQRSNNWWSAKDNNASLCFPAYPTSVQIINTTNNSRHFSPMIDQGNLNPAPGVCLIVIVNFCHEYKIPYNYTVFPNYMGHFAQREAQQELEVYDAVVDVRCYELAALFLCSVFVPKCGPGGNHVRPCRSLCYGIDIECAHLPYPSCTDFQRWKGAATSSSTFSHCRCPSTWSATCSPNRRTPKSASGIKRWRRRKSGLWGQVGSFRTLRK